MNHLSESNVQQLRSWVMSEPSTFYVTKSYATRIEEEMLDPPSTVPIEHCPVCILVPRFPMILPCSPKHMVCHICYLTLFKFQLKQRDAEYSIKCPICRFEVTNGSTISIYDLRRSQPTETLSIFYSTVAVPCPNDGCQEKPIPLIDLYDHQLFTCPFRRIQCPNCNFISPANQMEAHFTECLKLHIYCQNCSGSYRASTCEHDCVLVIRNQSINNKPSQQVYSYQHGEVQLHPNSERHDHYDGTLWAVEELICAHHLAKINRHAHRRRPGLVMVNDALLALINSS